MSSLTDVKRLHEKLDRFYAGGYLATWCDGSVRAEWAGFLHEVFSGGGGGISVGDGEEGVAAPVVLDVGCGPSICNVISGNFGITKQYKRLWYERFQLSYHNFVQF